MEEKKSGNCLKDKKFLFWKWKTVEHDYKPYEVKKFMNTSEHFMFYEKCSVCGHIIESRHFMRYDELLKLGLKPIEIENITDWNVYRFNYQN